MNALTTPTKTLFLSYSRRQTEWCNELYTAIDTDTPYYRWRDNKIPESADWWNSICLNIEGCYAFVAILTQDYLDSVYCMGELDYALKLNKPVIALMLQEVDYPQKLKEMRLQFARVGGLDMLQVTNKVSNAITQITLDYIAGNFSTDIHPRQHLRPTVPTPKTTTPTPEEDEILEEQIREVAVHGQIHTRDLMRRYNEEKGRNIRLARDLLDKIAKRQDVPIFFDVDEENVELQTAEKRFAEEERQRQLMKQIRGEYDDLAHYVSTARPKAAMKAIKRFMDAYPEYGDPQELMQKFRPMPIIEQSTSKEIPKSKPATTKTKSTISSEKILPQPFAWVEIPGGKGIMTTYDSDITLKIPSEKYWIAKYPVTNAQFAKFMEAGGYHQQKWWTEEGWSYRQKEKWTQPLYWRHSDYNGAEKPVVGVSWFESVAFCLWLSDETGEKIMLPTDEQWQFAAQGTDNRAYPWGNTWNPNLCQNNFSGRIGTSPVTQYENKFRNFLGFGNINDGTSPFGVVDMVGNVWEWCVTDSDKKTDDINASAFRRVFRGGCWYDINLDMFRCDHRSRNFPHERMYVIGFRLSHSS